MSIPWLCLPVSKLVVALICWPPWCPLNKIFSIQRSWFLCKKFSIISVKNPLLWFFQPSLPDFQSQVQEEGMLRFQLNCELVESISHFGNLFLVLLKCVFVFHWSWAKSNSEEVWRKQQLLKKLQLIESPKMNETTYWICFQFFSHCFISSKLLKRKCSSPQSLTFNGSLTNV